MVYCLSLLNGANKGKLVEEAQPSNMLYLVLAFVQSIGITAFHLVRREISRNSKCSDLSINRRGLTTSSMIVTWLGEQITDKRIRWCFNDYLCGDCVINSLR